MNATQTPVSAVIDDLLGRPPFELSVAEKTPLHAHALCELTRHHYARSKEYRRMLDFFGCDVTQELTIQEIPFIPVRMFKEYKLSSVQDSEIVRTMTSSGTTGQAVSKIYLDKVTAANQTKVLVRIMSSVLGNHRLPFLVIDSPAVLSDRSLFSARGAGILGFSMLGYDLCYALDSDYRLDLACVDAFLEKHKGRKVFVFGFTSIIWDHLCQALRAAGRNLQIHGVLLHGGGWKKLESRAVDRGTFCRTIAELTGISAVRNYYGMIEQTGSIFVECEYGVLHTSVFSDVLVRDPISFAALPPGQKGLLQLLSLLPTSYPGHSLLSEDIGEIVALDGCLCGRRGTCFRVHGRIKNAEVRGCSDTYATRA